jgi:hypothetical protein
MVEAVRIIRAENLPPQPRKPRLAADGISEAAPPVEVQVTIGHIEVRTAPASLPAPARRAPRAGVSLNEYLRRRNGGTR